MDESIQKTWERTYNHFKDGYKNSQDAIRFVDTKTGVITGLTVVTTAIPFGVLKWAAGLDSKYPANLQTFQMDHEQVYRLILAGAILGIVSGVCGIAFGIEGIAPRSPKKYYQGIRGIMRRWYDKLRGLHKGKNDKPPTTVLFPFYKEKDEVSAKTYFHNAAKGMSEKAVIREYENQIGQIGRILCLKIECNQRSAFCFRLQLWVYLITAFMAFCAITFFGL
jgi:hypothetical protein